MSDDCRFKSDDSSGCVLILLILMIVFGVQTCGGPDYDVQLDQMQHQLNRIEKRQIWKGQ